MKRWFRAVLAIVLISVLAACGDKSEGRNEEITNEQENPSGETRGKNEMNHSAEKIAVTLEGGEIIINVYNNPTAKEFLEQLPLTMTFEEFGGFEKLSYPPEKLTVEGAPSGYTPQRGDFAYYAPWGDVAMFYNKHSYSAGLVKIGEIESGVELLETMEKDFTVSIKRVD
ncbi:hypothetical protein GKZ89_18530 [Bacillus mangrovi]|uniref:Cyclophilin-like domain-containing protein n=1 Tax=Metabacillus mangrovi TaxID=1491830 RepID=A0A7X2V614_9BACI|nr:cyclophilin-like fold protein [Metabacillus mangrovi]MTH55392.1 hypothetical protein [Metabacillus mangrovi]